GQSRMVIRDECQVLYESDSFDQVMDIIAQKMPLSSCTSAVIFVPDNLVSFRHLELPFRSDSKIRKILPFELETVLPDPEEVYISDFLVLGHSGQLNAILSASIPESFVDQYFCALARFNVQPLMIAPTGYAAAASFLNLQTTSQNFVFLHIAKRLMTLVVVHDEKPCAVRSFGSENMNPADTARIIRQTLTGVSQRTGVNCEFELFICSDDHEMVHASVYKAFDDIMAYETDMTANRYKIDTEGLLCSIRPDKKHKYLLNFCRGKYSTHSFLNTYFNQIAVAMALLICTLSLMMISVSMDNARLKAREAQLDQQAVEIFQKAFPQKKVVNDVYMEMQANVRTALEKNGKSADTGLRNRDLKVVGMLTELSARIDDGMDMEIERFLFNDQRLVLSGATDNFNNVDRIKLKLESSDMFKKVTISSAASDKKENRVNFKFVIDM
ncbi:MAG: PilN domain-containing protein, partial [Proteobacteria bacterium]|nr:PilN domain-containing protein [Pseudomonadota bacterium]